MLYIRILSRLVLTILVSAVNNNIQAAPTHHLTIGVQGKTPTLIVTSSEIGITPQTMESNKKLLKTENIAKESPKKSLKSKFYKNQLIFNKKDKIQREVKPFTKPVLSEENSLHLEKTQQLEEKVNKSLRAIPSKTVLLINKENTTLKMEALENTTQNPLTASAGHAKLLQRTTAKRPKQITEIPIIEKATPLYNSRQPEVLSTPTFQATVHSLSTPSFIPDVDSLNIFSDMPATLNLRDFKDTTATQNYNDNTNTATTSGTITQTPTEIKVNEVVVQTEQNTTQIVPDKSIIKMENENDSDRHTHASTATTERGSLLLSTKEETNAYVTSPSSDATSPSTLGTLVTENTEPSFTEEPLLSLSLTMKTTAAAKKITVDDTNNNEQQQPPPPSPIVDLDKSILKSTQEASSKDEERDKVAESQKAGHDYTMYTETATEQANENFKSTESTLENKISQTTPESILNEITTNENSLNKAQAIATTTETDIAPQTIPLIEQHEQTLTANPEQQTTTTLAEQTYEATDTPTTETVLKLIDLEKHVVKTIGELTQPSLVMTAQHDNGHDGLKNIKKKQLVDKHFLEALLHNKQDFPENEKYSPYQAQETKTFTAAPPSSKQYAAKTNKTILMPIKHGYLGPILMEEKTFHVVHRPNNNMTSSSHHSDDIESQLRKGHFVELKVQKDTNFTENLKNTNIKSSSKQQTEMQEMQSDQPYEILNKQNVQTNEQKSSLEDVYKSKDYTQVTRRLSHSPDRNSNQQYIPLNNRTLNSKHNVSQLTGSEGKNTKHFSESIQTDTFKKITPEVQETSTEIVLTNELKTASIAKTSDTQNKTATLLSTTVFQNADTVATKTPIVQGNTIFTADNQENSALKESKISDIQIEVYDSTVDSIIASTNFKDIEAKQQSSLPTHSDESYLGKTTKPPIAAIQQERFTQYVIDRTETSTPEPINYNTIRVASGKPEPAAIEIHINVSESFGNESEDVEFSYPQSEDSNNNNSEKIAEQSYDDSKINENIKLKIPSNPSANGKELRNDEILVVEVIDTDRNDTKSKNTDELFITDTKDIYTTLPPPPPPPPYQTNYDRDSDTIFYISNTEVKVGESLPTTKNANEERKLRLESQFFPANYMASTHPSLRNPENLQPNHHLYEEDIILSPSRNQADSLKIYRNNNEPSPPLDVTYVGESIIEVEQSPESAITTTYAPDQQLRAATPQADVIIQPAILPEISIGVPVIGELPPQIEIKEIDFMPNEAQLHRSGIYDDNNDNNDINENTINGSNNNHDVDVVSGNSNNNQRLDESSIQYGGDLIDESADGGFDGVEGSYPFGNPTVVGKSSSYSSYSNGFLTKLRKQQQQKQQPNHVADYAHLYINYGVNNMRKDELSADVKEPGEMVLNGYDGNAGRNVPNNEQNSTSLKDFLSKVGMSNSTMPFINANSTHSERMSNATAFSVMEDANDLEDKNTEDIVNLISLAIGLFIVILPVVVTCSMFWALRYLYKKYHSNIMDNGGYADQLETKGALNENGVEKGEFAHEPYSSPTNSYKDTIEKYQDTSNKPSTTDSNVKFLSEKSNPQLEILPSNTNTTIAYSSSAIVSKKSETLKLSLTLSSPMAQTQTQAKPPPSASSPLLVVTTSEYRNTVHDDVVSEADDYDVEISRPNGSITKMTLENNLLIVETEERNDISRVARETKMDYNKKGVFVVEVSRGIDSKAIPESPVTEGNEKLLSMFETKQNNNGGLNYSMLSEKNSNNNEKVQIHSPPSENPEEGPRSLHQIEEVDEPINSPHLNENSAACSNSIHKANTGLSQSDLSSTSSSDSNKGYCYGNQALYVVEQKDYISNRPNGNVVLKCDIKDIKDDDHNPGNDHYLEHSLDKKEEVNKHKEDIVKTCDASEEGESRTSSGESPEQKQNEKELENFENASDIEDYPQLQEIKEHNAEILERGTTSDQLRNCESESECNLPNNAEALTLQSVCIPVQIEVHITPAQDESCAEDTLLSPNKSPAVAQESAVKEEIQDTIPPAVIDSNSETAENLPADEKPLEITSIQKEQDIIVKDTIDEIEVPVVPDEFLDNECYQTNMLPVEKYCEDRHKNVDKLEIIEEKIHLENENEETFNGVEKKELRLNALNGFERNESLGDKDPEAEKNQVVTLIENDFEENKKIHVHLNGSAAIEGDEEEETHKFNAKDEMQETEYSYAAAQTKMITNGSATVLEEEQTQQLENGHAEMENNSNSMSEIENGYDSILSLPEPPPTTDEQQNNDLSEQQLDSLPPPPPPEIFNLKALPPPLTNGNADSPQSEESSCFYNLLPPPPPTALEVTTTTETATVANGKVHASPLTPPASPPAHFTTNLHAGLCSQPIAVDVNGS